MSAERIEEIFTRLLAFPTISEHVTIVWHAGEPLVLGCDYYEEAFRRIRDVCPPSLTIDHSFQTNATLLDEAWCDLIQKWDVKIGVSIDGPAHIHDAYRRTRAGKGTFDQTLRGMNRLKQRGIPFYVISVLTKASFRDPDAMFAFYKDHEISEIGFNVEELEGVHTRSGLAQNFNEGIVSDFFSRFRDLMELHDTPIVIRELEEVVGSIQHLSPEGPINNLTIPFGIITIGVDGQVYTFSPELAGFTAPDFPTFAIGNILSSTFSELQRSDVLTRMVESISSGIAKCRAECVYFPVCGGGAPSNKIFENGSFASSETMHCRLTKKQVTDFVLGVVEGKASGTAAMRPPNLPTQSQ